MTGDFEPKHIKGRIMGIDYGSRRVGIAISDPEGKFALPHSVVANDHHSSKLLEAISALADANDIREIVMGESRDYKGKANPIQEDISRLREKLEERGFVISLEPEFMTSIQEINKVSQAIRDRSEQLN